MECLFCQIANKKIQSFVIYENDYAVAFLDIMPRVEGMTILIPKKHISSFDEDLELASKLFELALKIGKELKAKLKAKQVLISTLPSKTNHFNIRLYPIVDNAQPLNESAAIKMTEEQLQKLQSKLKIESLEEKPKEAKQIPAEHAKRLKEEWEFA